MRLQGIEAGWSEELLPLHSHVCFYYSDQDSLRRSVAFLRAGLDAPEELCVLFADTEEHGTLLALLQDGYPDRVDDRVAEGKLAVLKGFVLIARQEGAESVNCGKNAPNSPPYHDIHISIVQSADETDECSSVVAETSPHHRPPEWNAANLNAVGKAHLPVRITGHLFFDSSHVPCADGKPVPSNPKRVSLWELHPVYEFEVCTANCDAEGTWAKLEDWAKTRSKSSSSGRKKSSSSGHKKSS